MIKKTKKDTEKPVKKVAVKDPEAKPKIAKKTPVKPKAVKKEAKPSKLPAKKVAKAEAVKTAAPSPVTETPKKIETPKPAETVVKAAVPPKVEPPKKAEAPKKQEIPAVKKVEPAKVAEEIKVAEEVKVAEEKPALRALELDLPIALKDLASRIGVRSNELIVKLMARNIFATINQNLGEEMVKDLLKDYGIEYKKPPKVEAEMVKEHRELEEKQDLKNVVGRPPVVTFMGHVDHGKTSLLDFIRKTRVADKEKGGITQHIGAYEVKLPTGSVTFLDTPGHEAFTAMRARGANATDVVVLVIAADDGVMPQTKEAVDHARSADVPIVVALNKCDLPTANVDKVKGQLSQIGLMPEDWGGKTITVPVSAKTGEGVDRLLELLLLEAEMLELKANPSLRARGVVIEGKLSSGQGPVATVLVKNGTLHVGDMVLSGSNYGRVKAMLNHKGDRIEAAPPSKRSRYLYLQRQAKAWIGCWNCSYWKRKCWN